MDKDLLLALVFLVAAEDRRRLEAITTPSREEQDQLAESIMIYDRIRTELFADFTKLTGRTRTSSSGLSGPTPSR